MIKPVRQSPVLRRIRRAVIAIRRFVMLRVLHADDSPHRLAMGCAVGAFIAFTPTFGLQIALFFPICWLLRGNSVVGFPILWITNAVTVVPVYMAQYWIGATVLNRDPWGADWKMLQVQDGSWWQTVQTYWQFTLKYFGPLGVGSLITATLMGLASYAAVSAIVKQYRLKRFGSFTVPRKDGK